MTVWEINASLDILLILHGCTWSTNVCVRVCVCVCVCVHGLHVYQNVHMENVVLQKLSCVYHMYMYVMTKTTYIHVYTPLMEY